MKKLRLELDSLCVQSFETARGPAMRGTVQGRAGDLVYGGDGLEIVAGPALDPVFVARTEGSCGAPDCKTEPAVCPP